MTAPSDRTFPKPGSPAEVETGTRLQPRFDKDGLIAAVATDTASGEVLMLAWMNAEALRLTLDTGVAHFWSRSRARIWKKGEESGNILTIDEMRIDCDQDAVWMKVTIAGQGVACHTGATSCFYRVVPVGPAAASDPALRKV